MFLMQDVINYVADELTKHLKLVFYVDIYRASTSSYLTLMLIGVVRARMPSLGVKIRVRDKLAVAQNAIPSSSLLISEECYEHKDVYSFAPTFLL